MSEVSFQIGDRQVATVRVDPNSLQGRELAGLPVLYMPLKLQLLPAGPRQDVQYTIVRLAGILLNQQLGEFARFEVPPVAWVPTAHPYDRPQDAMVGLDRLRVKRFEDARAGGDAYFQIMLSCLVWYPAEQRFDVLSTSKDLDVLVPSPDYSRMCVGEAKGHGPIRKQAVPFRNTSYWFVNNPG